MSRSNDLATTSPTVVSDKANTSAGYLDLPSGTTAQRPETATSGNLRYNTEVNQLEFYSGTTWVAANESTPTISSISGNIYVGLTSNLTISGGNFNVSNVSVQWLEGSTILATNANLTPTNDSSITIAVPSQVYGQTIGDTISIKILNAGTVASNASTKTVLALPSGGTIITSGGYYYHKFTSTGTTYFVNTLANLSVDYLIVAGGGGCGREGGGGGAGGFRYQTSQTLANTGSTDYPVVVGAGGAGGDFQTSGSTNGSPSSFNSHSTVGGGAGSNESATYQQNSLSGGLGHAGGSGGGGGYYHETGGSGTSGQGNDGGDGIVSSPHYGTGGGGGAGSAGVDATHSGGGAGGDGVSNFVGNNVANTTEFLLASVAGTDASNNATTSSSSGTLYIAGGGGGAGNSNGTNASGGKGGGGRGEANGTSPNPVSTAGLDGTGSGGGGGAENGGHGADGGDGIVIIRYVLP